ncbi:MAG: type ISP restriction/modification enzyme [Armatimonadota bacterium]|nr:N-6 DNA methylase [bacterium]
MANTRERRQLAAAMAGVAAETRKTHGDLAAQSVVYGLFVRRWEADASIGTLQCEVRNDGLVEKVETLLDGFDLETIFADYFDDGKDPAVYFYEEFLRHYDSTSARGRGVHYSPPGVVSFIVKGVESLLREHFGIGLDGAVVVDPCCGAGTFLRYIEKSNLPVGRLLGLELMPVPCALASALLNKSEIIRADGLEAIDIHTGGAPLVIVGNPPYSGHSSNAGKAADLMMDYKAGLTERNPKWLQDDYVKFIRVAQERVEKAGRGVVAFITNHSFIFNPTFRVMRTSLMKTFDEILVLDLAGNAKTAAHGHRDSDGSVDENVFPIQMGVAISFMVRSGSGDGCRVRHCEIKGSRASKLKLLASAELADMDWSEVRAEKPFHTFRPINRDLAGEYYSFESVIDMFRKSSVGFVTSRDAFAIDNDRNALLKRIGVLRDERVSPEEVRERYPVGDLDIELARRILLDDCEWEDRAVEVLYRPFDRRWAYLSRAVMERPRLPFMEHLQKDNVAIALGRAGQVTGSSEWDVVFCTDCPTDLNLFRRGGAMLLPKYVYNGAERAYNFTPCDGQLFTYIYALLHSSVYRQRYADFLGVDYPRVPIPDNRNLIEALAGLGQQLIDIHLMRGRVDCDRGKDAMTSIGGYSIPAAGDSDRIKAAVRMTLDLRSRIDAVIEEKPPWK